MVRFLKNVLIPFKEIIDIIPLGRLFVPFANIIKSLVGYLTSDENKFGRFLNGFRPTYRGKVKPAKKSFSTVKFCSSLVSSYLGIKSRALSPNASDRDIKKYTLLNAFVGFVGSICISVVGVVLISIL